MASNLVAMFAKEFYLYSGCFEGCLHMYELSFVVLIHITHVTGIQIKNRWKVPTCNSHDIRFNLAASLGVIKQAMFNFSAQRFLNHPLLLSSTVCNALRP